MFRALGSVGILEFRDFGVEGLGVQGLGVSDP